MKDWDIWDYFAAVVFLLFITILGVGYALAVWFFSWREVLIAHLVVGVAMGLGWTLIRFAWPIIRYYCGFTLPSQDAE